MLRWLAEAACLRVSDTPIPVRSTLLGRLAIAARPPTGRTRLPARENIQSRVDSTDEETGSHLSQQTIRQPVTR